MNKILELISKLGIALTADQQTQISEVMSKSYKTLEEFESTQTELAGIKEQLTSANSKIKEFEQTDVDGIKEKVAEWETKYNEDTAALKKQMEQQNYDYAVSSYLNKFSFASDRIKNSVLNDIKAKEFKIDGDKLIGADEFMTELQKNEPTSFAESDKSEGGVLTGKTHKVDPKNVSMEAEVFSAFGLPTAESNN